MLKQKRKGIIFIITLLTLTIFSCSKSADDTVPQIEHADPPTLEKAWEVKGLENPESVVLDTQNNVLYVSNVNGVPSDKDGNGYISKVGLDGTITELKWITGLNAPKGLVIYNGKLYATDIDEIVEINISTKAITKHAVAGATFLNDIVVDETGNFYISNTFGKSVVFKLSNSGTVSNWLENESLNMPNGLNIRDGKLITAGWGNLASFNPATHETNPKGQLISVDLTSKEVTNITTPVGNLDGLSQTDIGYFITDFLAGKVLFYSYAKKTVVDVLTLEVGNADTYYDKATKSIYIPSLNQNKLYKYTVK